MRVAIGIAFIVLGALLPIGLVGAFCFGVIGGAIIAAGGRP